MASLWRKSQEIIRDNNDLRAAGARAYFFSAGTTTPLSTFKDNALTTPHTHPVIADASGRMPAVFFAVNGVSYKERVETGAGSLLWEVDDVDPAPAVQEATPGTVDSEDLLDVGVVMPFFQTGVKAGWVRCNGRTIGSASSGATERANADCQELFAYLWNYVSDSFCPVSGGRGASAPADWAANKAIGLPDLRGRMLAGLDDMGNSPAGAFSGFTFATGAATTLASRGGQALITIQQTHLPNINLNISGLTATTDPTATIYSYQNSAGFAPGGATAVIPGGFAIPSFITTIGGVLPLGGSGSAMPTMSPFALVTWYMKLRRETT